MGRALVLVLFAFALLVPASGTAADEIHIDNAILELTSEGPAVSANFRFDLPPKFGEALLAGVPLFFIVECEISRARWYWFDEPVASAITRYRLSYHSLAREYRLSSGALHSSFASLEEALNVMTRLQSWVVADRAQLRFATHYDAWLRMRLDSSQLPRPLQVTTIGQREWTLTSPWRKWRFMVPRTEAR
jgi:Domain of unknown function (DUF4390)